MKKRLIFVAHQDDETIGCGGAIAKWAAQGSEVEVCYMTDGGTGIEQGSADVDDFNIIEKRMVEATAACDILGVSKISTLALPCQKIKNTKKNFHAVIKKIREIKPDMVLTHNTICKHRDHKNTSILVEEAAWKSSENILEELGAPHRVPALLSFEILDPLPNPDFVIDITETFDIKMRAMAVYTSQRGVIPGIEDYLDGLSKVRGYSLGPHIRAEAFKRIGNIPLEI